MPPLRRRYAFLVLAALSFVSSATPTIRIDPGTRVLEGDAINISVEGATPGSEITLTAERWIAGPSARRSTPRLMRSQAVFVADSSGRVDLRTARPQRGTYEDPDPRGLFWSMRQVPDAKPSATDSHSTSEVRFALRAPNSIDDARLELMPYLPQVRVRKAEGLPGALFASLPSPHKRPVVVLLGGSEGGTHITHDAAPLASRGFAVLALPVFSPPNRNGDREIPELPAAWADLPVETLNRAHEWLSRQPDVDASRVALHGTSMGALLALLGAAHLPWVDGVVASVPSDVVWDGWGPGVELGQRSTFSVAGKPLPFVPLVGYEQELQGYERNEPVILRRAFERGRSARPDLAARARVPVERIRVPVMVIGSYDDQMWPSGQMAQNIVERRIEAGLETEALIYQDAGHSLYETGYSPTTTYNAGLRKSGGTPKANAAAQAEIWPRTIQFLKRVLAVTE